MLTFPSTVRIYVAAEPVDLRKGFDGLSAATRGIIRADPLSGHLFCFINRRRNRMKVLLWQPSGYVLVYKRLERGRFYLPYGPLPGKRHIEMEAAELTLMLEGIELKDRKRRERWIPKNNIARSLEM